MKKVHWLTDFFTVRSKTWLVMKIFTFLILLALQVSAKNYAQENITISSGITTIGKVFKTIESQTKYHFYYSNDEVNVDTKVNLIIKDATINKVMEQLLFDLPLDWKLLDDQIIVITPKPKLISVSEISISGIVNDEKGKPISLVTVNLKGSTVYTTTDNKGKFTIKVKNSNSVLSFSHIGYMTFEQKVGNAKDLIISLTPKNTLLDEVIVIGYGEVKKSDLTGSVAKISGQNNTEHPYTSMESMLQGKVAGVQITQNTGALASGMTFSVRGNTSITGSNQPLIVIDGYPVSSGSASPTTGLDATSASAPFENILATINPNDIESIEILKDASSTAIYGSRGANGVVIITTKRGKAGKDVIDYNYREDFSNLPKKIGVLNTQQYIAYANEANSVFNTGSLAYSQANLNSLQGINTNWQDLIYQMGIAQSHQLSFSGGDQRLRYSIALGYLDQQGIVIDTRYRRGTLRMNIDKKVTDKFSFGMNVSGTVSLNKAQGQSNPTSIGDASIVGNALKAAPIFTPFLQDGTLNESTAFSNPLTIAKYGDDENRVLLANTSFFTNYSLSNGLKFSLRAGVNPLSSLRNYYWPRGTFIGNSVNGQAYQGTNSTMDYLTETTLSYNKTIGKHRVNAVMGYTWQDGQFRAGGFTASGFPNDQLGYTNFSTAKSYSKPVNSIGETGLASYLFRTNYVFADRYMFTITARYDGSTRLAEGHKWAMFPAIAIGWNVSKESFMQGVEFISQLKLRMSYGISGNQTAGIGSSQSQYSSGTAVIGESVLTSYNPNFPNKSIGWESTKQFNAGLDFGALKDRLTMTLDMYQKQTHDLLINLPIPASSGFTSYSTNAGVIENKGLEITASFQVLKNRLRWTVGGNISFNSNKVISFDNTVPNILSNPFGALNSQNLNISVPGKPIGMFYGYKVLGIYQTQNEIDTYSGGAGNSISAKPGSFKIADINGDGKVTSDDRTILGSPYPNYFFGITNDFFWKSFSLNILIQGSIGQHVANTNRYYLDALNRSTGTNVSIEAYKNRWTGVGTSNKYPAPQNIGQPFYGFFTDFIIEDASFVRLKSVTIAYTLKLNPNVFINNLKLFISGTNLFSLTKYTGYDPEINSAGANAMSQGIDNGTIPQYRTISGGVKVSF